MRLSRHAKNNMRLYGITEEEIEEVINSPERHQYERNYQISLKSLSGRFGGLPLKVVFVAEKDEAVIITAYPLRKGYRRRLHR
ncbi:MAG: DUF4258 domain-containing protein [Planctomycetota bacterium]|nr:DUF4258 domain-containing protein [Planctomycetota bacterium]